MEGGGDKCDIISQMGNAQMNVISSVNWCAGRWPMEGNAMQWLKNTQYNTDCCVWCILPDQNYRSCQKCSSLSLSLSKVYYIVTVIDKSVLHCHCQCQKCTTGKEYPPPPPQQVSPQTVGIALCRVSFTIQKDKQCKNTKCTSC